MDELVALGADVEYWDIGAIIHPHVSITKRIDSEHSKIIYSIAHFRTLLDSIDVSSTIFACEFYVPIWNAQILRLIKKSECKCVKFYWYDNVAYPSVNGKFPLFNRLRQNLMSKMAVRQRLNNLNIRIETKLGLIKYDKIFSTSSYSSIATDRVNHYDYQTYCNFVKCHKGKIIDDGPIVFLDIDFPKHSDFRIFYGYEASESDCISYYDTMSGLFDIIEKQTGKEVVIAAHPKSAYKGFEYGGRKIIKNKTIELVASSSACIMHASASISFIALFDKPIVFVVADQMKAFPPMLDWMKRQASYFKMPLYSVSPNNYNEPIFSKIDPNIREDYICTFLASPETRNMSNGSIIIKYLNEE